MHDNSTLFIFYIQVVVVRVNVPRKLSQQIYAQNVITQIVLEIKSYRSTFRCKLFHLLSKYQMGRK